MPTLSKKIIGITGNIACGKTSAVSFIKEANYPVIECDLLTKEIYQSNQQFKIDALNYFNEDILTNEMLDAKKIANIVFKDKIKLTWLNNYLHPLIKDMIRLELTKYNGLVFIDIPLLYEAHFEDVVDEVILVWVNEDIQLERLMKRNNLSIEQAKLRMNNFIKQDIKKTKANYLIDNNTSLEALNNQVQIILNKLRK